MSVVLTDFADGVAVITLNRPEAKNAVNLELAQALAAAIDEFEERSDLTIGILTGAGGTFCAGMDLKGFARGERPSLPGRGFAGLTEAPAVEAADRSRRRLGTRRRLRTGPWRPT